MAYGVGSCKNRSDSDQNRPVKLGNLTVILASKRSIIRDSLSFADVDINDVMSDFRMVVDMTGCSIMFFSPFFGGIDQYRTLPHGLAISIYHLIFHFLSFFKCHPNKNQPENRLIAMVPLHQANIIPEGKFPHSPFPGVCGSWRS